MSEDELLLLLWPANQCRCLGTEVTVTLLNETTIYNWTVAKGTFNDPFMSIDFNGELLNGTVSHLCVLVLRLMTR